MSPGRDRKRTIVLCHGWAMQDWFWEPLRQRMGANEYLSASPAYFSESANEFEVPTKSWIGLGHSQGFRRLAELELSNCQALISVSGFWDFCGEGGTSKRIVQRMVRRFRQDPMEVLRSFYLNCGLEFEPPEKADLSKLQRDLEQLSVFEEAESKKKVECHRVPVFAITGAQDKIVPCELAKNQFVNLNLHPRASHVLGYDEPDWCAEQIDRFLTSI